jgi:hypothetical protein
MLWHPQELLMCFFMHGSLHLFFLHQTNACWQKLIDCEISLWDLIITLEKSTVRKVVPEQI